MQAIERAFAVLRAIKAANGSSGVSDVARNTGLPKSTVSRLLSSLEEEGIVERVGGVGRYTIGPGLVRLAGGAGALGTLKEVTYPYLRDLTEATGESSGLTVPDGNTALYLDHVPSDGTVRTRDWTGMRFPFHTIASGLALMMTWSEASVERLADRGLETFTEHTITTKEELISRLTKARRQGFVWTMGDFDLEINGVAAPVRNQQGGAIGAISTYGPSYRFPGDKDMGRLAERVRETARLVQEQIRA